MADADIMYIAEKTKKFSVAQLNELYTSAALQWHYDRSIDIESLVENLEEANKKARKQEWETEDNASRLGFGL